MHLLHLKADGEFGLTKFDDHQQYPPYAILSHTWAADSEEVTFKELTEGTGKNKAGYGKIRFCADQAARDDLQYFWVDTCCIDKTNNTELGEAITSMFRWYQAANKCYAYLSDVLASDDDGHGHSSWPTWEPAFQKSRWFTRGWTLQELIAPKSVEFFSFEGTRLGDKKSLEQKIYEITGIAVEALQGRPLASFSVHERMLWAAKRKTKRKEDEAYSLVGIFEIYMTFRYGEGENAMFRLKKKIDKLSQSGFLALSYRRFLWLR
jgi:Heterokaryon incompatibility protein (HET)